MGHALCSISQVTHIASPKQMCTILMIICQREISSRSWRNLKSATLMLVKVMPIQIANLIMSGLLLIAVSPILSVNLADYGGILRGRSPEISSQVGGMVRLLSRLRSFTSALRPSALHYSIILLCLGTAILN